MDAQKTNRIGLTKEDYKGAPSTLCTGCGHDLLSAHIISACYSAGISPAELTKMSGIGCSSKTPAYFMSKSFAFNSMHGRMASISTGAKLANRNLRLLGVSGDGDTANIGLGGFIHAIRRNLPICYLVANNGVYGLTKGQLSATAEKSSSTKSGQTSSFETLDLCLLALESGCNFVARSYVGDPKQLVPLIQAALEHDGTAVIDVISPCVTFNNHDSSTKSYTHLKKNERPLQDLEFVIETEPPARMEQDTQEIHLNPHHKLLIRRMDSQYKGLQDRTEAIRSIHESHAKEEILTGLFYHNSQNSGMCDQLAMTDSPLASLQESELRPSLAEFESILMSFK